MRSTLRGQNVLSLEHHMEKLSDSIPEHLQISAPMKYLFLLSHWYTSEATLKISQSQA